jgi:hypothetical protein
MLLGTPGWVTTGARTRTDANNANTANGMTLQGGLFCVADAPAWSVNGVAFRMDGPDVSITIQNSYFTACKGNVSFHPAPYLPAPLTRGALRNHVLSASRGGGSTGLVQDGGAIEVRAGAMAKITRTVFERNEAKLVRALPLPAHDGQPSCLRLRCVTHHGP